MVDSRPPLPLQKPRDFDSTFYSKHFFNFAGFGAGERGGASARERKILPSVQLL